jgi:hypothetical protein
VFVVALIGVAVLMLIPRRAVAPSPSQLAWVSG